MTQYKKILIIKPSSLGDVVHSLPLLHALKSCFPDASVHWVLARGLEGLLDGHPLIDRLWIINKDGWKKGSRVFDTLRELWMLSKDLRSERYDLVIDLQGLLRSGLIAKLSFAPLIIGFGEAREGSKFLYTYRIKGGRDIHAVDRYLTIAKYLGCAAVNNSFPLIDAPESMITRNKFGLPDTYAVIVPGARWETKKWPPERFGKVVRELPVPSLILGSSGDIDVAEEIVAQSEGRAVSLAGKTSLRELVSIIQHALFMLTNDTGPMHIAAAASVPVYAVFGPTSEQRTGPYGSGHTVFRAPMDCAPCFRKECDTAACMKEVTAEEVLRKIQKEMHKEKTVS